MAVDGDQWLGLLTYHIDGDACEIVTLDSERSKQGIGTALIEAVKQAAQAAGCRRRRSPPTTTRPRRVSISSDVVQLAAIHCDAVSRSRQVKPEIPFIGNDGIPIRDEIELEIKLSI